MDSLKARVRDGRLRLDPPTDGTVVEIVPTDEVFDGNDDLSDQDRSQLHQEIVASIRERRAGAPTFDADDVLNDLAPKP